MSASRTLTGLDPATGTGLAVEIADGVIAGLHSTPSRTGPYLAPGLVDLQVNGYGGLDFNAPELDLDMVLALTEKLAALGTTTFLPTLITGPETRIVAGLATIAAARRRFPAVRRAIAGVHIEGPSIGPEDGPRGAHPREHVRPPDLGEFERWQAAGEGLVRLVTLSPHYADAPGYISALAQRGVLVAIGHTGASPDQVRVAVDCGARLSTHLGNGAAAMLPRHPNFIWTQLADDRLTASFITDGHHLGADVFKAMVRAKGLKRAILVSDSVALAGMPPGRYGQPVGGEVEVQANGRIGVAGTPYLAGAGHALFHDLGLALVMGGLALHEGLELAAVTPGALIGRAVGLKIGTPADILVVEAGPDASKLSLRVVLAGGREQAIS